MTLQNAITHALDLTQEIRGALDRDDLAAALDLIPRRGEVMESLQAAHRSASDEELASCRALLRELRCLDETLQEDAGTRLEAAARDLHASTSNQSSRPEKQPCLTSCIDRRA